MSNDPKLSQPQLNIYGQTCPHDDVIIVGNRLGITHTLRTLIDTVERTGGGAAIKTWDSTGENYQVTMILVDDNDGIAKACGMFLLSDEARALWQQLPTPGVAGQDMEPLRELVQLYKTRQYQRKATKR